MDDEAIVALYWQRDETAIQETQQKYGAYLAKIARQILPSREDGEESVNDTYLKAWNSIPPHRPGVLPPTWGGSSGSCRLTSSGGSTGKNGADQSTPSPSPSWRTASPAGTAPGKGWSCPFWGSASPATSEDCPRIPVRSL